MKISFDFDDTLENFNVQKVAKDLKTLGYDVCILTTRYSDTSRYNFECSNDEVFEAAKACGITEVNFTEYEWKYTCIDNYHIDIHIDDNYRDEVHAINDRCKAKAVLYSRYGNDKWEDKLYELIHELEKGTPNAN